MTVRRRITRCAVRRRICLKLVVLCLYDESELPSIENTRDFKLQLKRYFKQNRTYIHGVIFEVLCMSYHMLYSSPEISRPPSS